MCKLKTYIFFILAGLSLNCYRDQPSSYNIDKIQSIDLISPQGGERFKSNQSIQIKWTSANIKSSLRIELKDSSLQIFSIDDIPDIGNFYLQIPSSAGPSKYYKLIIESMDNPEVNDATKNYFEIVPVADGQWFYSNVEEGTGMEIWLNLWSYVGDSFQGEGTFYFKYLSHNELAGYEGNITVNGILSYPQIGFEIKGDNEREFDLTGRMTRSGEIRGKITGFIDSTYSSIDDSLVLLRQ